MRTQNIQMNLTQKQLDPILFRTEETGREIEFTLLDPDGTAYDLTDYTLKFTMLKPDGNVIYQDLSGGILTQTEQMTTSRGIGYYAIRVSDQDTLIYTGQGKVVIDDHVITDEALESISEVDGLTFPDDFLTIDDHVAVIDDTVTSTEKTWSSFKISDEIDNTSVEVSKTVEGNPVIFIDGADAPLVNCVTAIQGNQDLHGYDKPWVGGAGKNKLPMTVSGIKSANTSGTWNGNVYTYRNVAITILTDGDDNVIGFDVNGTANSNLTFFYIAQNVTFDVATIYSWGSIASWNVNGYVCEITDGTTKYAPTEIGGIEIPSGTYTVRFAAVNSHTFDHKKIYPMIRLSTETDSTFAPYSNICPITAYNQSTISVEDENEVEQATHTATFSQSIYQGTSDFVGGVATTTWGYIASYNGETLPGEWISDRDEYIPNTSPTTGAEVAYALATPTTETITPTNLPIKSLFGYNHIESSTGDMVVEYITHDYQSLVDSIEEESRSRTTKLWDAGFTPSPGVWLEYDFGEDLEEYDAIVILFVVSGWEGNNADSVTVYPKIQHLNTNKYYHYIKGTDYGIQFWRVSGTTYGLGSIDGNYPPQYKAVYGIKY